MAYTLVPTELIVDGAVTSAKLDTNISISGTLGVTGELTLSTHMNMGDNDKIKIGTGGDLEIYHDGSNSYISNSTGNIYLADTNGSVHIQAKLNEESIVCTADGAVSLYHDNAVKLATSSSGIDVTGTVTADGLTVDTSTLVVDASNNRVGIGTNSPSQALSLEASDTTVRFIEAKNSAGSMLVGVNGSGNAFVSGQTSGKPLIFETNNTERFRITGTGGLEFQNQDFSNIGTIYATQYLANGDTDTGIVMQGSNVMSLHTGNSERMRIDSGGNILIGGFTGTTSGGSGSRWINLDTPSSNTYSSGLLYKINGAIKAYHYVENDFLIHQTVSGVGQRFFGGTSEAMRIGSSGGIGFGGTDTGSYGKFTFYQNSNTNSGGVSIIDSGLARTGRLWTDGNRVYLSSGATGTGDLVLNEGGGNVGIGTNGPATELHVKNTADCTLLLQSGDGSTAEILFGDASDASRGKIKYLSTDEMTFEVNNLTEAMRIRSDGDVYIAAQSNTWGSASGFYFNNAGEAGQYFAVTNTSSTATDEAMIVHRQAAVTNGEAIQFYRAGGIAGAITVSSGSTSYNTSSDYRLKTNIQDMQDNGVERVKKLRPVTFNWIEDDDGTHEGFIAHEVQEAGWNDGVVGVKDDEERKQSVDYGRITPLLVKAIQEQQTIIDDLKSRIETLENE